MLDGEGTQFIYTTKGWDKGTYDIQLCVFLMSFNDMVLH